MAVAVIAGRLLIDQVNQGLTGPFAERLPGCIGGLLKQGELLLAEAEGHGLGFHHFGFHNRVASGEVNEKLRVDIWRHGVDACMRVSTYVSPARGGVSKISRAR